MTNLPIWFAPAIGFLFGALFIYFLDKKIPHLHLFKKIEEAEGPKTDLKKTELLVIAIAIHNIPEGLAVGVAFGALSYGLDIGITLGGAIALAIGMGLQNAPEGFAVSRANFCCYWCSSSYCGLSYFTICFSICCWGNDIYCS